MKISFFFNLLLPVDQNYSMKTLCLLRIILQEFLFLFLFIYNKVNIFFFSYFEDIQGRKKKKPSKIVGVYKSCLLYRSEYTVAIAQNDMLSYERMCTQLL